MATIYKYYEGSFVAVDDSVIRCEIWRTATPPYNYSVGELRFPAENPLVVEWQSEKTDTIVGSTATLVIVSPGDRTYVDLYTVEAGSAFLKVYKDNALWWVGSLDTEFYQEPYSRYNEYEVSLTFSDFGLLHRLLLDVSPFSRMVNLSSVLTHCISNAFNGIYTTYTADTATTVVCTNGSRNLIEVARLRPDNFIDEDGEASTLYDVLEAVLRPLALRIQQRAGALRVYDYHTAANLTATGEAYWNSNDQQLAVDATYNRIVVTFSPYAQSKLMDNADIADPGLTGTEYQIDTTISQSDTSREVSFYYRVGTPSQMPDTLLTLNRPMIDITGQRNIRAVAAFVANVGAQRMTDNTAVASQYISGELPQNRSRATIYKTKGVYITPQPTGSAMRYLRIQIPMMFDGRYCPFADAGDGNEQGSRIDSHANAVYLNCRIKCGDYYLINNPRSAETFWHYIGASTGGSWQSRTPASTWQNNNQSGCICSLMYYQLDGETISEDKCGATGFTDNLQPFGNGGRVDARFQRAAAGLVCPVPPVAGDLTIEVLDDLVIMDAFNGYDETSIESAVYKQCRWWLIGLPSVDIVTLAPTGTDINEYKADDIEQSGYINPLAKDELSIDTICGCAPSAVGARGALWFDDNGTDRPLSLAIRNSRSECLEQLLIGTIYSQYAAPHTVLIGTIRTPSASLPILTEAGYTGKKFLITAESCNLIAAESTVTLTELTPDTYTT